MNIETASMELLLILKRFMLYYCHQWVKTAKDYTELLKVAKGWYPKHNHLCELFKEYNVRFHGPRPENTEDFVIESVAGCENCCSISREQFEKHSHQEKISHLHEIGRAHV